MSGQSKSYVAGKSEDELRRERALTDIIRIGSNENPIGPSPMAVKAMQKASENLHRYPPMTDDEIKAALSDSIGRTVTPENLITGNGACDILSMIASAILGKGTECIICRPTFPVYESMARRMGANVIFADLDESFFAYDVVGILRAVSEKTRIIHICNPNNPTGSIFSSKQLDELLDGLPNHVLVVADEVYHHFNTDGEFPATISQVLAGKNVIVVHSFSKAYGMAGARLGYGIASPDMVNTISKFRLPFHINNVTLQGGLAALRDTGYLRAAINTVASGRRWLYSQLVELGAQVWPSQANFLLFKTSAPADELCNTLLSHGIIIRPMDSFYLPGFLRVSVGLQAENERFIDVLREILAANPTD